MSRGLWTTVLATVTLCLALGAGAATAAPSAPSTPANTDTAGVLDVRFAVSKVVVRGKRLVAVGNVIGTVRTADGTKVVRAPFASPVKSIKAKSSKRSLQRSARICDILNLNLAPLRLELLGLIVELDRVVLNIRANSQGGLLGSLLCGLAGSSGVGATPTAATARTLTKSFRQSGLSAAPVLRVPLQAQALPPVPAGICTVLDLQLGPLDLNLLGLLVHLDRVHLRITADPEGGLLGGLLCGLAGGPPVPAAG